MKGASEILANEAGAARQLTVGEVVPKQSR